MLQVTAEWNQPCRGMAGAANLCLAVRIRPGQAPQRAAASGGVQVLMLLDVSSSMDGDKLDEAKQAVRTVWSQLNAGDQFCLLTFSGRVNTPVNWSEKGKARDAEIDAAIERCEAAGITLLHEGLSEALRQMENAPGTGPKFIWVVTDGDPTTASGHKVTDLSAFLNSARQGAQEGISIGALGLGNASNFNANFLRDFADHGGGSFCYAPDPAALASMFSEQVQVAHAVSATRGRITLTLQPGNTVQAMARVLPEYAPLETSSAASGQWVVPFGAVSQPETIVLFEITNAALFGSAPGKHIIGEVVVAAEMGDMSVASTAVPIELELAAGNSRKIFEKNQPIENLRIAMELARNADLRARAPNDLDKLRTTERLVELSRRTGDAALIEQYEAELEQIRQHGNLTEDQETQAVVNTRTTGRFLFKQEAT